MMSLSDFESIGTHDTPDYVPDTPLYHPSGIDEDCHSPHRPTRLFPVDHENEAQVEVPTGVATDDSGQSSRRSRAFVFTANGTECQVIEYSLCLRAKVEGGGDTVVYCIAAKEIGESGNHHIQGYIYFKNARGFGATKTYLSGPGINCHIQVARGTPAEAAAYCKKGEGTREEPLHADFWEFGTIPKQGIHSEYVIVNPLPPQRNNPFGTMNFNDLLNRY